MVENRQEMDVRYVNSMNFHLYDKISICFTADLQELLLWDRNPRVATQGNAAMPPDHLYLMTPLPKSKRQIQEIQDAIRLQLKEHGVFQALPETLD